MKEGNNGNANSVRDSFNKKLNESLLIRMGRQNITNTSMAEKMLISRSAFTNIMNKDRPRSLTAFELYRVCIVFQKKPFELIQLKEAIIESDNYIEQFQKTEEISDNNEVRLLQNFRSMPINIKKAFLEISEYLRKSDD